MTKSALKTSALAISTLPFLEPEVRKVQITDWVRMPDFFAQRDHEVRATQRGSISRFSALLPTHLIVAAVRFQSGSIFKLDGHTRTQAWLNGLCDAPPFVYVVIYDAASEEEARAIYEQIDGPLAVKKSADAIFSAFRELNFIPKSPLIRKCEIGKALNIGTGRNANRGYSKRDQVIELIKYIKEIDKINPDPKIWKSHIMGAAFLSMQRFGPAALLFWHAAQDDKKKTWTGNAHTELLRLIQEDNNSSKGDGGTEGRRAAAGRALAVFERWARDASDKFEYESVVSAIDPIMYLRNYQASLK